jgi:hypothetical protein
MSEDFRPIRRDHIVPIVPFKSNAEAALYWYDFGYTVLPLVPGEKRTAVGWSWADTLTRQKVSDHWSAYPEHEVGFIVGPDVLVLDADSPEAVEAIKSIEVEFGIQSNLLVGTSKGFHFAYRPGPGVFARADSHSTKEYPERIDVKTGRTLVNLPPSGGRRLLTQPLRSKAELVEVPQAFIDAVFLNNGRLPPRPREQMPPPIDDEAMSLPTPLAHLEAMLKHLDPDPGYHDWSRVLMAVHHETNGSPQGLAIVDRWSARGRSYKGTRDVETHWRSFRAVDPPVTVATIKALLRDAGHDWREICAAVESDFEQVSHSQVAPALGAPTGESSKPPNPLDRFSLLGHSATLEKSAVEQRPLLGSIVIAGQFVVIYAAPGTGKTLILLYLVISAIEQGRLDPSRLYYINVDDDSAGLLLKVRLAEEHGFHMLADGFQGFDTKAFVDLMQQMVDEGQASGVVVVLDTLKKFTDLMDKTRSSTFTKIGRQFVAKGGTLVCLAHTNKSLGQDGKPVYAGSSDFRDDADCAYTIRPLAVEVGATEKTVLFENIKRRGMAAMEVAFAYAIGRNLSYHETLASVREIDPVQVTDLKATDALQSDAVLIEVVASCIRDGINTKMTLAKVVSQRAGVSKRTAIQIIERYTGDDPGNSRWRFVVGARGAKVFELLE